VVSCHGERGGRGEKSVFSCENLSHLKKKEKRKRSKTQTKLQLPSFLRLTFYAK